MRAHTGTDLFCSWCPTTAAQIPLCNSSALPPEVRAVATRADGAGGHKVAAATHPENSPGCDGGFLKRRAEAGALEQRPVFCGTSVKLSDKKHGVGLSGLRAGTLP